MRGGRPSSVNGQASCVNAAPQVSRTAPSVSVGPPPAVQYRRRVPNRLIHNFGDKSRRSGTWAVSRPPRRLGRSKSTAPQCQHRAGLAAPQGVNVRAAPVVSRPTCPGTVHNGRAGGQGPKRARKGRLRKRKIKHAKAGRPQLWRRVSNWRFHCRSAAHSWQNTTAGSAFSRSGSMSP
jgi:hypothetical protein